MLSVTGPAGFYMTPVNKVLLVMSLFFSLLSFPLQQHRHMCTYSYDLVIERGQYWRLLTSKLAFLDIKDVALCSMLIYNFRFLERRFGSRKYASYLLAVALLSTALEMLALVCCHRLDITFTPLPSGPFCLVFPQFVQFFLLIPRVAASSILGVPVTGKTFTYILGLQVASGTAEYRLVTTCALAAGLLWQYNVCKLQTLIFVPGFLSRLVQCTLGRVLQGPAPAGLDTPIGATLDLQRQERLQRMEEQLMATALRNSSLANGHPSDGMRPQPLNVANGPGIFGRFLQQNVLPADNATEAQHNHSNPAAVSEDQVERLTEMGFNNDSVRRALRVTNNDISQATNILLQEAS